jgi:hypothetical protein
MCKFVVERTTGPADNPQPYLGLASHAALLRNKRYTTWAHTDHVTFNAGAPLAASDPFGYTADAQGLQNIFFRATNGHAYELWRSPWGTGHSDVSGIAGAPPVNGEPKGYFYPALGTHNLVYRGTDGHAHIVWWTSTTVGVAGHDDVSALAGAPGPAGNVFGYVYPPANAENMVYRAGNNHLYALYWTTGAPGRDDLTAAANAPLAAGDPFAYFMPGQEYQYVFYRGTDGHVHVLYWGFGGVVHRNLSAEASAPTAAGDPVAFYTTSGQHNVVYRGTDGRLHDLWWTTGALPGHDNLSAAVGGAPLPVGDPTAFFDPQDQSSHVIYRTSNGHLHELTWIGPGAAGHTDLTTATWNTPASGGDPASYRFAYNGTSWHVIYRDTSGYLHDITSVPGRTWIVQ